MDESWKTVDEQAPRPSPREALDAAQRLRFQHRPELGTASQDLLEQLRSIHGNRAALLATFDVEDDATSCWFASRNRFDELGFFPALLRSDGLGEAVPSLVEGLGGKPPKASFDEVFAGSYLLDGWLAGILMAGGAYERFEGTPQQAREVARAAADEVIGGRYDDVVVYRTFDSWSPWFYGIAWDVTGIAIDLAAKRVTLLAITDTD